MHCPNYQSLSSKRRRFVDEYLLDLNAQQAAIRAGYSPASAGTTGHRLLKDAQVAAAIEERKASRVVRTQMEQDEVLLEIADIARSDVRKLFTQGGFLRSVAELDDDIARAVSAVKVVTRPTGEKDDEGRPMVEYVHEFKLWDKNAALEKLMKHTGGYERDNAQRAAIFGDLSPDQLRALLGVVRSLRGEAPAEATA